MLYLELLIKSSRWQTDLQWKELCNCSIARLPVGVRLTLITVPFNARLHCPKGGRFPPECVTADKLCTNQTWGENNSETHALVLQRGDQRTPNGGVHWPGWSKEGWLEREAGMYSCRRDGKRTMNNRRGLGTPGTWGFCECTHTHRILLPHTSKYITLRLPPKRVPQ